MAKTKNIRKDPLTKLQSIHPDLTGKPLPKNTRALPNELNPCPFCVLAKDAVDGKAELSDGSTTRPLLSKNDYSYATTNRWGLFGIDSTELIIPYEHLTDLETMSEIQIQKHFELTLERYQARSKEYSDTTFAFINIGLQSGSSIPHLHSQIMNPPINSKNPLHITNKADISEDIKKSNLNNLTLIQQKNLITYIPYSPIIAGEVRIAASDLNQAVLALQKTVKAAAAIHPWSYNIVMNFTIKNPFGDQAPAYLIHFLPRFELGSLFQIYLRTAIQSVNQELYHSTLKNNLNNLQ